VAWIFGWGNAAFPDHLGGFFLVYILSPLAGGTMASLFFVKVIEPQMMNSSVQCGCTVDNSPENK